VAGGLVGEKLQPAALQEITLLRGQVLELRQRQDLSKELIREVGDPALARLKELILIDRAQVLARLPELEEQRQKLAVLGAQWEACEKLLAAQALLEAESADESQPTSEPLGF